MYAFSEGVRKQAHSDVFWPLSKTKITGDNIDDLADQVLVLLDRCALMSDFSAFMGHERQFHMFVFFILLHETITEYSLAFSLRHSCSYRVVVGSKRRQCTVLSRSSQLSRQLISQRR